MPGSFLFGDMCCRLAEESEEDTCCYGTTDYSGYVWSHGMHEEVVVGVGFQTFVLTDAGSHWHSTNTCISDERIDFVVLRKEDVHDVYEDDTAGSCDDKRKCTECEDLDCVECEEFACLSRTTNCETEQHNYDIVQGTACSLGETSSLGAFLEKVSEE